MSGVEGSASDSSDDRPSDEEMILTELACALFALNQMHEPAIERELHWTVVVSHYQSLLNSQDSARLDCNVFAVSDFLEVDRVLRLQCKPLPAVRVETLMHLNRVWSEP